MRKSLDCALLVGLFLARVERLGTHDRAVIAQILGTLPRFVTGIVHPTPDLNVNRFRNRSSFARPYISRFVSLSRLICPSVCP
jgi:hypothetical protein